MRPSPSHNIYSMGSISCRIRKRSKLYRIVYQTVRLPQCELGDCKYMPSGLVLHSMTKCAQNSSRNTSTEALISAGQMLTGRRYSNGERSRSLWFSSGNRSEYGRRDSDVSHSGLNHREPAPIPCSGVVDSTMLQVVELHALDAVAGRVNLVRNGKRKTIAFETSGGMVECFKAKIE